MKVKTIEIREDCVWLTGSEDGWSTQQNFCDLHEVSGFILAMNPFNRKPMFVMKDRDELLAMLRDKWPGATFE